MLKKRNSNTKAKTEDDIEYLIEKTRQQKIAFENLAAALTKKIEAQEKKINKS